MQPLLHLPFVPFKTRASTTLLLPSHTRKHLCQKCQPPTTTQGTPFSLHQPPNLTWYTMTAVIRVENKKYYIRTMYNKYIVNFCAACGGKLNFARNTQLRRRARGLYTPYESYSAPILHTTRFFPIVG